jgi:alcohol dehydrogenase (cytochrome c)
MRVTVLSITACSQPINGAGFDRAFPLDSANSHSTFAWVTYGHDYGNLRYSPLNQITPDTATNLVPAYVFQTGIVGAFETSPIASDGALYITTAYDAVFAIRAENGKLLWKHAALEGNFRQCCGPVNRGVAITKDSVLLGQLDGKLVALDRKTGAIKWSTQIANNAAGYSITMAPLVYRDSVIVGVGGGDLGIRGAISALSLRDGKVRWRWYATDPVHWFGTSPELRSDDARLDREASRRARVQFANSWMHGGGGIWTTPALDPRRDMLYLTTGNPWPDFDGSMRPGDNLFTNCVVALNATTGRMRWYFQEVPHDTDDLDAASPPVLFDTVDAFGHKVPALAEVGKTGVVYILNRETGKLIRSSHELTSVDIAHGGMTGWTGGSSWSSMSFDPTLGYVIVSSTLHRKPDSRSGVRETVDEMVRDWQDIYSTVTAVNTSTGKIAWQDQFDGGLVGGTSSTSGGVTFVGEGDGYFDALNTSTGERVWQFNTGAGVNAPPVVFEVNNKEYVAVASGGNQQLGTPKGDALFVFHIATH